MVSGSIRLPWASVSGSIRLPWALVPALLAACSSAPRDPMLTYFSGEYALSLRYPSSWKTEQAEQDGLSYRYFLAPPSGQARQPAISVTLLAGPLSGSLDDYAQTYVAGNTLTSSRPETRTGAKGQAYEFTSADGQKQYSLLLLEVDGAQAPQAKTGPGSRGRVYGLYAQGAKDSFVEHRRTLEEMAKAFQLERPSDYPEQKNAKFAVSLRVPPSWQSTRNFSGGEALLMQFTSPPMAADRRQQLAHTSLTLSVEKLPSGGDIESFYGSTRQKLGEAFVVVSHTAWQGGYMDVMSIETPVASSHIKRFYRVSEGRGYSLACEARDDVYPRVFRWCDMIAGTLRVGAEAGQP